MYLVLISIFIIILNKWATFLEGGILSEHTTFNLKCSSIPTILELLCCSLGSCNTRLTDGRYSICSMKLEHLPSVNLAWYHLKLQHSSSDKVGIEEPFRLKWGIQLLPWKFWSSENFGLGTKNWSPQTKIIGKIWSILGKKGALSSQHLVLSSFDVANIARGCASTSFAL